VFYVDLVILLNCMLKVLLELLWNLMVQPQVCGFALLITSDLLNSSNIFFVLSGAFEIILILQIQEILSQSMNDECKFTKILLIMKSESNNELTASCLNLENCTISNASSNGSFSVRHR
jgi:hypothetical protein